MTWLLIVFTAINFYKIHNSQSIPVCKTVSYCSGEPCSSNGNCYVDLFKFYNITSPDKSSKCICNRRWITSDYDTVKCCYQKKLQSVAFLLEFIIGFGSGHFYVGNVTIGFIKFSSYILICYTFWIIAFLSCFTEDNLEFNNKQRCEKLKYSILLFGTLIIYFIWQIVDIVLFGINFYTDGNGYELEEW